MNSKYLFIFSFSINISKVSDVLIGLNILVMNPLIGFLSMAFNIVATHDCFCALNPSSMATKRLSLVFVQAFVFGLNHHSSNWQN